jgi:hypothetical protein
MTTGAAASHQYSIFKRKRIAPRRRRIAASSHAAPAGLETHLHAKDKNSFAAPMEAV